MAHRKRGRGGWLVLELLLGQYIRVGDSVIRIKPGRSDRQVKVVIHSDLKVFRGELPAADHDGLMTRVVGPQLGEASHG